jgi:hypothetical protein
MKKYFVIDINWNGGNTNTVIVYAESEEKALKLCKLNVIPARYVSVVRAVVNEVIK